MTVQIAVRLPADLLVRLDSLVPGAHESRSAAVREAVEMYLAWTSAEQDSAIYARSPLTEAELAMADDPDAWSATPPW